MRSPTGRRHEKLRESAHDDFFDFSAVEPEPGLTEESYRRVTYDMTMAAARTLLRLNPGITFIYVSGAGTDSTERGRVMWARVKGATENALLALPFKAAYMFRPGFIQPLHEIISKTKLYRAFYGVTGPIFPLLKRLPKYVTTTEQLGRAMLEVARHGAPQPILESADINSLPFMQSTAAS